MTDWAETSRLLSANVSAFTAQHDQHVERLAVALRHARAELPADRFSVLLGDVKRETGLTLDWIGRTLGVSKQRAAQLVGR